MRRSERGLSRRYSIPGLKAIYGAAPTPDTAALIELKRWRSRADDLIHENKTAMGLDLISEVSALTQDYRHSRKSLLAPGDRLRLIMVVTPPLPKLLPQGDEAVSHGD